MQDTSTQRFDMGTRRFGRVNWLGTATLASREVRRFMAVWTQTLLAPLVTAGLFLAIFSLAIGPARGAVNGVPFAAFLAPGILMMTVIQNAFANTSSSIMIAKVQGNIVDTLMPPLSAGEMLVGYLAGAVGRGVLVAFAISALMWLVLGVVPAHPVWALVFVVLGSAFLGGLGIIAAIYASKFDQMAAITNFIITPLSFLSGTFYSIESLPPVIATLTRFNPVFYLIDGARFGFIGASDAAPAFGLVVCLVATAAVLALCWQWLRSGYRMKA
ncbi:Inner membrane transport permease YadH [Pseudoruegeria aquimaris]|uniref:Transport permease protein n=1 Tax=Pseudoruegeria aquimaris TaxID=393663 RepID=A0A1Y5SZL9_9RHOB|nr:ABC transporter permease [Pseudoruegeria aquimaris]SLN50248.1 Inner membrane transport permease YadH [Pseudoruegeria aquimaris]